MSRTWIGILGLGVWVSLLGSTALAGTASRAELNRLDEDMRTLIQKSAWSGVERTYLQMTALSGVRMTHEQHLWGAAAARARGDVLETWKRLRAAEEIESRMDTLTTVALLEATHGRVVIEASPLAFGALELTAVDPLTDPGQLKTLAAAATALADHRHFDGLLPLGSYRVGALRFEIDGGPMQRLMVPPGQGDSTPTTGGVLRWVARTVPPDPAAFASAAEAVRQAVLALDGVASVEVHPPPSTRIYAEFTESTLEALELSATDIATAVRSQLGLPIERVLVTSSSIGVLPGDTSAEALWRVDVPLSDGSTLSVASISHVIEAVDRTQPPAGLRITAKPETDVDALAVRVAAAIADVPAAAPLSLVAQ